MVTLGKSGAATDVGRSGSNGGEKVRIEEMTWVEVDQAITSGVDTVVLPVGATEQHGPHGVFGTDSFCAEIIAEKVSKELSALLAPLMPFGLSSSHMKFKGTISLSPETFMMFSRDVLTSLVKHGFKKIVVINGNEPNYYPMIMVARTIREETGVLISISNWYAALQEGWKELPGIKGTEREKWRWSYFMAHGGILETSASMAHRPGTVRMDLATTFPSERREVFANPVSSLPSRIDEVTPQGSYGDPRASTMDLGASWTDIAAGKIVETVRAAWKEASKGPS